VTTVRFDLLHARCTVPAGYRGPPEYCIARPPRDAAARLAVSIQRVSPGSPPRKRVEECLADLRVAISGWTGTSFEETTTVENVRGRTAALLRVAIESTSNRFAFVRAVVEVAADTHLELDVQEIDAGLEGADALFAQVVDTLRWEDQPPTHSIPPGWTTHAAGIITVATPRDWEPPRILAFDDTESGILLALVEGGDYSEDEPYGWFEEGDTRHVVGRSAEATFVTRSGLPASGRSLDVVRVRPSGDRSRWVLHRATVGVDPRPLRAYGAAPAAARAKLDLDFAALVDDLQTQG
jgi:hypothetical protein